MKCPKALQFNDSMRQCARLIQNIEKNISWYEFANYIEINNDNKQFDFSMYFMFYQLRAKKGRRALHLTWLCTIICDDRCVNRWRKINVFCIKRRKFVALNGIVLVLHPSMLSVILHLVLVFGKRNLTITICSWRNLLLPHMEDLIENSNAGKQLTVAV